jgi:hypothetical protein
MRKWTAQESDILHTGESQIRNKLAASPHEPVVFFPLEARANALLFQSLSIP